MILSCTDLDSSPRHNIPAVCAIAGLEEQVSSQLNKKGIRFNTLAGTGNKGSREQLELFLFTDLYVAKSRTKS